MGRDYNIKLTDLKRKLKYLKKIDDGSDLFRSDIFNLETFIKRYDSNFQTPLGYVNDDFWDDVLEDVAGLNHSSKIISILQGLNLDFNPFAEYSANYTSLYLSDNDAVDLAYEFYKTDACVFYNSFLDVYDSLPNHLQFIQPNKYTDGEVINLRSTRDRYIFSPSNPDITKVTILIHEIQHAIDGLENNDFSYHFLINEVASLFMELLACDFAAKKLNVPSDGDKRKASIQSIIVNDSIYLVDKFEMFQCLNGLQISNLDQLYAELNKKGYPNDEVDEYLKYSVSSMISYQLPLLIAIELYKLYKADKIDALETLLGIVRYGNNDNIFAILEGLKINPGSSFKEYQDDLVKKLKLKRRF